MSGTDVEEEKEVLVYLSFNTKLEEDYFSPDKDFRIIGLDEERPVLQLGNQVFQGEWQDTIGTHLFLEESKTSHKYDPTFSEQPEINMKYACKADKVLHMSRIFLNPKKATSGSPAGNSDHESEKEADL